MKDKTKGKKQKKKDLNVFLSKSHVPTNLSKYPKVTVDSEEPKNNGKGSTPSTSSQKESKPKQETVNISLSKTSVPTNLSKHPTVTITREEREASNNKASRTSEGQSPKRQGKDVNIALSKSKVPTNLSKYPKLTITDKEGRAERNASEQPPEQDEKINKPKQAFSTPKPPTTTNSDSRDTTTTGTVQLKKGLKVALRKSNKALDLTKYPKIVVTNDDESGTVSLDSTGDQQKLSEREVMPQNSNSKTKSGSSSAAVKPNETVHLKKELKVALRKSDKALDLTKYPKVHVKTEDADKAQSSSPESQQKSLKQETRPKKTRSGTDSIATKINETVELKKGLKVALRKSAKAIDLTKYPKVAVDSSDNTGKETLDSTAHEEKPIKFADHIKATDTNDTVQLMKNLKLSLSKSARAIDLRKYPKVTVDTKSESQLIESEKQAELKLVDATTYQGEVAEQKADEQVAQKKARQEQITKQKAEEAARQKEIEKQQAEEKARQEQIAKQKAEEAARQKEIEKQQAEEKARQEQITKQKAEEAARQKEIEKQQTEEKARQEQVGQQQTEKRPKVESDKKESSKGVTPVKKPKRLLTQTSRTIPKIMDPTRRRDNATVRLAASQGGLTALPEEKVDDNSDPASDTVVLKVIKEKKKKLAGILSASQTIRLRPPSEPGLTPGGATPPATEPAIPKKTLKLKTPDASPKTDQGAPQTLERRVLKLKPSTPATAKARQGAPTAEGEQTTIRHSKAKRAVQKSGTPTAKATLKIKVPASAPKLSAAKSADDRQLKATLKIKAPTSSPSAAASANQSPTRAAGTAGKAVVQSTRTSPPRAKTLKLKAVPRSEFQQLSPAVTGTQADRGKVEKVDAEQSVEQLTIETDVFYTVSAAASLAVVGTVIFLMASQFISLF